MNRCLAILIGMVISGSAMAANWDWDGGGGAESQFLAYYTGDSSTITFGAGVTDGGTNTFATALALNNGDRFGIAWNDEGNAVNRSRLETMDINVIPEPATLGLLAACGGGILFIRRCFII